MTLHLLCPLMPGDGCRIKRTHPGKDESPLHFRTHQGLDRAPLEPQRHQYRRYSKHLGRIATDQPLPGIPACRGRAGLLDVYA